MQAQEIRIGGCYSNGDFGRNWCVWQVVDVYAESSAAQSAEQEMVRYRILVGQNRRKYQVLPRAEFAGQVRYEVVLVENSWQRVD